MRNKIAIPRIYTNSTLWLMASGALSFEYMARKTYKLNQDFGNVALIDYFYKNKMFNTTPTDISFVDGQDMSFVNTNNDNGLFFLYAQGIPQGLESSILDGSTLLGNRFFDHFIVLNHNFSRFVSSHPSSSIAYTRVVEDEEGNVESFLSAQTGDSSSINYKPNESFNSTEVQDGFTLGNNIQVDNAAQTSGLAIKINFGDNNISLPGSEFSTTQTYPFFHIGSAFCAKMYDFKRSANLEMEIEYVYDGIKKQKSINGSTYLNSYYNGRSNWGIQRPFENQNYVSPEDLYRNYMNTKVTNNGRRRFKIRFSYLEDKETFNTWTSFRNPRGFSSIGQTDYNSGGDLPNNNGFALTNGLTFGGIGDGSLYGDFISRTLGGSLPFIMCLDRDEATNKGHNPDNWALCMLDGDSIRFTKVADDFYDVELTIDEVF